jgi:uncharacterized protein (DUF58 family)
LNVRQAAVARLRAWSARRHGRDTLPMAIHRRRIYIVPTRFGLTLGALLIAMLIAGLNYNSNLALAFAFLIGSYALVAMHHCHRNLLGLIVDATAEADAFAGGEAGFDIVLRNPAPVERCDLQLRCGAQSRLQTVARVPGNGYARVTLRAPVAARGVVRWAQFELRTNHPFGWFRAWSYVHAPLTAYVAPAPRGERPIPGAAAAAGTALRSETRGDEEFAGLRTYQPGMALKHMAWKVLAGGGEAAVRSYSGVAAHPEWLDWSMLDGLEVEARLAQLCRWVLDSEAAQRPYGLRIPGREIAPACGAEQRCACLRALAGYGIEAPP